MIYISIFVFFLSALYGYFIHQIHRSWSIDKPREPALDSDYESITVIVIARNEEQNIKECLQSILSNNEVLIDQIIVVDDHSDDNTAKLIYELSHPLIKLLSLSEFDQLPSYQSKYKKAGLHYALLHCRTEWVITTDADCIVGDTWILSMMSQLHQKSSDVVTGPISLLGSDRFIEQFQIIEMLGTMAGTYAGISGKKYYSANAANMLYRANDYLLYIVEAKTNYASGDDMFFVQHMVEKGKEIAFSLRYDSIVRTYTLTKIRDLFQQRLRWATKTSAYSDSGLKLLLGGVFLFHAAILSFIIWPFITGNTYIWLYALLLLVVKIFSDWRLLNKVGHFFKVTLGFYSFGLQVFAHCVYIVLLSLAGLMLKRYNWKGRKVR